MNSPAPEWDPMCVEPQPFRPASLQVTARSQVATACTSGLLPRRTPSAPWVRHATETPNAERRHFGRNGVKAHGLKEKISPGKFLLHVSGCLLESGAQPISETRNLLDAPASLDQESWQTHDRAFCQGTLATCHLSAVTALVHTGGGEVVEELLVSKALVNRRELQGILGGFCIPQHRAKGFGTPKRSGAVTDGRVQGKEPS